jgi:hypothetical protein
MLDDLKSQLGSSIQTVRRFLQRPVSVARGNLTRARKSAGTCA